MRKVSTVGKAGENYYHNSYERYSRYRYANDPEPVKNDNGKRIKRFDIVDTSTTSDDIDSVVFDNKHHLKYSFVGHFGDDEINFKLKNISGVKVDDEVYVDSVKELLMFAIGFRENEMIEVSEDAVD